MYEQSKSTRRRFYNGNFHNKYFNGNGIDIGGKPDPFSQYIGVFPLVKSVKIWDLEDGDAQFMKNCTNEQYDFVISSHCLEHMVDVYEAFKNWIRITKKGGYLIISVPDEDMYEQENWPSLYNADHKWTFTIHKNKSWSKKSINIFDLLQHFSEDIEIEKVEKISEFYNHNIPTTDQTYQPNVEAAIEFIIRKKNISNTIEIQQNRFHLDIKPEEGFSQKFSKLYNHIEKLNNTNEKYLVYGYGSVAKTLKRHLNEKIVAFVDKKSDLLSINIDSNNIYSPSNIKNISFDKIIISVLGRENEISDDLINLYNIDPSKIITL